MTPASTKKQSRSKHSPRIVDLNGLVLDRAGQEVIVNGKAHHLTPKECRLLATFMQHAGKILSREFLMHQVWDTDYTDDTRTLEVHVSWLRKKIEENPNNPQLILTVRGVGYMFSDTEKSLA